mmetsp:Transcript_31359/g.57549  ORF Transcript_31359/g.57549 Transcript_31359/m.57549 type:complete len:179 (-) Transcript_31359:242-778(-)
MGQASSGNGAPKKTTDVSGPGCGFRACDVTPVPADGPTKPVAEVHPDGAQAHRLEHADASLMSFSQAARRTRGLPDQQRRSAGAKSAGEDRYLQVKAEWERQVQKEIEEREAREAGGEMPPEQEVELGGREAERLLALQAIKQEEEARQAASSEEPAAGGAGQLEAAQEEGEEEEDTS